MANLFIRDVPGTTSANIKAEADRQGISQQELLSSIIEREFGEPPTVVMWIDGRLGEQGEAVCPECHQNMSSAHVALLSNGLLTKPVCKFCATNE